MLIITFNMQTTYEADFKGVLKLSCYFLTVLKSLLFRHTHMHANTSIVVVLLWILLWYSPTIIPICGCKPHLYHFEFTLYYILVYIYTSKFLNHRLQIIIINMLLVLVSSRDLNLQDILKRITMFPSFASCLSLLGLSWK